MNPPRISIALPVYNGEQYLRRAVDSYLAQDFDDFELLILDNASTDGTEEIGLDYAARDERVRYVRNDANIGAQANHNLAFELTAGEYFKWAAHDDWVTSDFLRRCLDALENRPSAVVCFTQVAHTDSEGEVFRIRRDNAEGAASDDVRTRLRTVIWDVHEIAAPVFGLMRRAPLEKTNLLRAVPEPDRLLIGELALLGPLVQIPEVLLYRYLGEGHKRRNSWLWVHHKNAGRWRLATPKLLWYHLVAIARASVPAATKASLSMILLSGFVLTRARYKYRQLRWRLFGHGDKSGFLNIER